MSAEEQDDGDLRERLALTQSELRDVRRRLAWIEERNTQLYNLAPVGHLTINGGGAVVQTNDMVSELLGVNREALRGQPLSAYVVGSDRRRYQQFQELLLSADEVQLCELRLQRADGRQFYAELRGRRLAHKEAGKLRGFVVIADVTERREMHEVLLRRNRELASLNWFAHVTSDSFELADVTAQLEALLRQSVEITAGAIFVFDALQRALRLSNRWGGAEPLPPRLHIALDAPALEQIISVQNALYLPDLAQITWLPAAVRRHLQAMQPTLFAPLVARGTLEGAIWLSTSPQPALAEEHISYFSTLAQQTALAMRSARLFAEVRQGEEQLRLLAHEIVSAQEEERRRIARELHDETGQLLTALKLSLEMLGEDLVEARSDEKAVQRGYKQLSSAIALSERTMAHIRGLVHNLRPTALDDLGLSSALEGLCYDFAATGGVAIDYQYNVDESLALSGSVQIVAYRFVQEALTNVSKHAGASRVAVSVEMAGDSIRFTVEDDGAGFDERAAGDGLGILGMRERLESVGGTLEIRSEPGKGARLTARIPVEA